MFKSKRGFTLIELLAVIVILAIIVVIATTSVGGAISQSRAKSFVETMEVAVKNAKNVIAQDGVLTGDTLRDSMDYKKGEYEFNVIPYDNGYEITLTPGNGRFKNFDFNKLSENERKATGFEYIYDEDAQKNTIIAYITANGKLVSKDSIGDKIADSGDTGGGDSTGDNTGDDGDNTGGGGSGSTPAAEDNKIGEDVGSCKAMEKKESFSSGDEIYFCNGNNEANSYKEEFYVMSSYTDEKNNKYYKLFSENGLSSVGVQTKTNTKTFKVSGGVEEPLKAAVTYGTYISGLLGVEDITGTISNYDKIIGDFGLTYESGSGVASYSLGRFTKLSPSEVNDGYWACTEKKQNSLGYYYTIIAFSSSSKLKIKNVSPIGLNVEVRPTITVPASVIEAKQ